MRSVTIFFKNQEELADSLKYAVYYNNSKLKQATSNTQDTNITSKYNVEDFRENSTQQRRSLKSLGKRREDEQDQEGECSKFIQERKQEEKRSFLEADDRKRYERKENNNNQREAKRNRELRANKQICYQDSSKSMEYIIQLVQDLEAKLSELGLKAPNRS